MMAIKNPYQEIQFKYVAYVAGPYSSNSNGKTVEENILERHLKGCVQQSFTKGNQQDKALKVDEIVGVLKKFRKY